MSEHQPPTPAARRQRIFRWRQQRGIKVYSVEVDDQGIANLIDAGLLNENEAFNDENIAVAIARLVGSPIGTRR